MSDTYGINSNTPAPDNGTNPYGNYQNPTHGGTHQNYQQQNQQHQGYQQGHPGYGHPGYGQPGFNNQHQAPGGGTTYDAYGNVIPADARTMAVFAHLSALLGLFFTATIMNFIGPLIFWLIYKDKPGYAFVRHAAAGAFNFSFTVWVVNIVAWIFAFVTFGLGTFISVPVVAIVSIASIVFNIIAAVKANAGEAYNYPLTIRVLK